MYFSQWPLILLFFSLFILTNLFGYYLGKVNTLKKGEQHFSRVSSIQAGLMGILGVMLAFSFSISSERFEHRRKLVNEESVKIQSAFYRAGLLPDTTRNEMRDLLKKYLEERINFYKPGNTNKDMQKSQVRAKQLQERIWSKTATISKASPNLNTNINILALTEMIEISGIISASFQTHLPEFIIVLLVFISLCTNLIMGYNDGFTTERNILFTVILNLVLCSILFLIMDLDRPTTGFLRADIYGLKELKMEIEKFPGVSN